MTNEIDKYVEQMETLMVTHHCTAPEALALLPPEDRARVEQLWEQLQADACESQADVTYAKANSARYQEAMEILRPVMENFPERSVAQAKALLSPEDAARVDALLPAYLKVQR